MVHIPCQRALFEIPRGTAYLDCAKMSPLSRAALAAGAAGLGRKLRPWEVRAEHFFDEAEETRGLIARLLGTGADHIAIVPSVSYGMAVALGSLDLRPGEDIITVADDFPSGILAARTLARRTGAILHTIEQPLEGSWSDLVLERIVERTGLVLMPHTHWVHGTMFDLAAIGRRCREVGAALVLDTTQSAGALPLDLRAVDPDYVVAAAYKWLMGPYSIGLLYAAERHWDQPPLEQSWITRRNAHDFRSLMTYEEGFAAGARRFDMGERSNFALLPAAAAAIGQLLDWGVENITATLGTVNSKLEQALLERGIIAAPDRAPHFLSVRFPQGLPDDIEQKLAAADVHVSMRGDRMRITPHLYNDEEDIARFLTALD